MKAGAPVALIVRSLRVVIALLLVALALPARAEEPVQAHWEYRLSIPDPTSGNVRVELTLRGVAGAITDMVFPTPVHRDSVTNIVCGPGSGACYCPADARLSSVRGTDDPFDRSRCFARTADAPKLETTDVVDLHFPDARDPTVARSFAYDVRVERNAFAEGQLLSHVGTDFALFKAEAFALEYRYSFLEGVAFENHTKIWLTPPAGWDEAGPWAKGPDGAYKLPVGQVLPRGYVALGKFESRENRTLGDKVVHYVRLGNVGEFEKNNALFNYIEKATPYYAAVYGPGVEKDVLVVNAPDPMFRGGLGGANSFFVHESADLRTVAHEYAHVFQLFGTNEQQGESAIWINEGDADYHSALSLFAADVWSPQQVNDFFDEAAKDARDPALQRARLPDAAYGTSLERFAYHKGTIVMRALDVLLRDKSATDVSVSDVLRELNRVHGDPSRAEAAMSVENEEMVETSSRLAGVDLTEFFARHVYGSEWPLPFEPFVPQGQLVVDSLVLTPERPAPGDPVTATAIVANRGTKTIAQSVDLTVDGRRVASENVSIDVGENATVRFAIVAPPPGDHEVKLLYASANLHSLTPANVTLARASIVPATVRAKAPVNLLVFIENLGEQEGTARVEASVGGDLLARTTETVLDGSGSTVLTLPLTFAEPGNVTIRIALITPQGESLHDVDATIHEPDADEDGVPDGLDAYPDDPRLWERSVVNDVKQVPGAPLALALAVALALALSRRRV